MKDWRNIAILVLGIILIYFIFSGRGNAIDQVRIDALEHEKKAAIESLFAIKKKTKVDSFSLVEHLRQDSINSIDVKRLETSLVKSRRDYKEAVSRFKEVLKYTDLQMDSVWMRLYPTLDK